MNIEEITSELQPIAFDPTLDALTAELESLKQRIRDAETLEDLKDLRMLVGAPEAEQKAAEERIKKLDALDSKCSWEKHEFQCSNSERAARQQWKAIINEQQLFESKYC